MYTEHVLIFLIIIPQTMHYSNYVTFILGMVSANALKYMGRCAWVIYTGYKMALFCLSYLIIYKFWSLQGGGPGVLEPIVC